MSAKNSKRSRANTGFAHLQYARHGISRRKVMLQKRLYYHQLLRHYNEVGARVGARTDVQAQLTEGPDGKYVLDASQFDDDELMTDLLDLRATKEAIRELAAELGINWLATDDTAMPIEETLSLIGQFFEGQHRTGRSG